MKGVSNPERVVIGFLIFLTAHFFHSGAVQAATFEECRYIHDQGIQPDSSVNTPPIFKPIPSQEVLVGVPISLRIDVCDRERMVPGTIAHSLPEGATLDDNFDGTRSLHWTPTKREQRTISFTAYDEMDASITSSIDVHFTVISDATANSPPIIQPLSEQTIIAGETLSQRVVPTDPDGDIPSLYSRALPSGANLLDNLDGTRTFVWTPSSADIGIIRIPITASDARDATLTTTANLVVHVVSGTSENTPPTIELSGTPRIEVGKTLELVITASDSDSDAPLLSVENQPAGSQLAQRDDGTYLFSWTPAISDIGVINLEFVAVDARDSEVSTKKTISLEVIEVEENGAPSFLDSAGGVVEITDQNSPIFGAKVVLENDTIAQGSVKIIISYEDDLPGSLNDSALLENYVILSKTILLSKDSEGTFDKSVEVTVPYDINLLENNDVPSVLFWNQDNQSYNAVAVTSFDPITGMVTFRTAHFSKYIVIGIQGLGNQLLDLSGSTSGGALEQDSVDKLSIDTNFLPSEDGFFLTNTGSYSSPGGNCLGMASYSDWFFENAKNSLNSGIGLEQTYIEGDPSLASDDIVAHELIVRAHAASSQEWGRKLKTEYSKLNSFQVGVSLVQLLKLTQKPQIFLMWANPSWWDTHILGESSWGHALVAYKFDATAMSFSLYDSNFPSDDSMAISFGVDGFGDLSKLGVYPSEPEVFAYDSIESIYSSSDMRALFDGADQGWSDGKFGKIDLTEPTLESDHFATVISADDLIISGKVIPKGGDASKVPDRVDVYVAGTKDGTALLTDSQFTYTVKQLPNPANTEIALVAYKQEKLGNRVASIYGTFKRFNVKVQESSIDNFGFERGSFENWHSERHTTRSDYSITPSDKSEISGSGFDPIASDIKKVLFGQYSARINNSDGSYHVSTISRDIVVPENSQTFRLSFNWAAILEDPRHTPEDQPYVNIKVTNSTQGVELYNKRFYSNDPSYSGWKSNYNGTWKAIDWQSVLLKDLAKYSGDTITVHIEAADCDRGAHGGYVYFDAEE